MDEVDENVDDEIDDDDDDGRLRWRVRWTPISGRTSPPPTTIFAIRRPVAVVAIDLPPSSYAPPRRQWTTVGPFRPLPWWGMGGGIILAMTNFRHNIFIARDRDNNVGDDVGGTMHAIIFLILYMCILIVSLHSLAANNFIYFFDNKPMGPPSGTGISQKSYVVFYTYAVDRVTGYGVS